MGSYERGDALCFFPFWAVSFAMAVRWILPCTVPHTTTTTPRLARWLGIHSPLHTHNTHSGHVETRSRTDWLTLTEGGRVKERKERASGRERGVSVSLRPSVVVVVSST